MKRLLLGPMLLCAACGGSGDGSTPASTPEAADALRLLEECVAPDTVDLLGILRRLETAAAGDVADLVRITGVDLLRVSVSFTIDLDGDDVADLSGTLRFEDADGSPTIPFDPAQFLEDPAAAIASVPDGTVAIDEWTILQGGEGEGEARYVFERGAVHEATGSGTIARASCGLEFTFSAVDGDPPAALLDFVLAVGDETVGGTVDLVSDVLASIRARVGDGPEKSYTLDLLTGAITPE